MKDAPSASELVINSDGSIYHLKLKPGDLADKIICVGDPGRVEQVAGRFEGIELRREKREFITITGRWNGQRLSVISTGIGTDNIDIVINEIDALFNIDFATRSLSSTPVSVKFMRLGTCGGMQPHIPVGTIVNSRYAIGGDGLLHFYIDEQKSPIRAAFQTFLEQQKPLPFPLYTSSGDAALADQLSHSHPEVLSGITFTASGFYGPQGRSLGRIPVAVPDLPELIGRFSYEGFQVLNMEMETSALLGLAGALGHQAASLCVILANRQRGEFSENPTGLVEKLIDTGLKVLAEWN